MPYKIVKIEGKFRLRNADTGELLPYEHDDEESAKEQARAIMAQENKSIKIAFDPFAKFEKGKPIRLIPEGTWYRGERTLDLSQQLLQEIEQNFKQGLPRYRVGINLNHEDNAGKVGDVKQIAYMPDGPSGPGIYATDYEFTEKGLKAIEEDGYDGVSAEMIWSINNGSMFQDPETGNEFDNVLVGVALTPHPFFGHEHVALYSNKPEVDMEENFLEKLLNGIKELLSEKEVHIEELATKREEDGDHPASHYLVVEDADKPSTWHLRYKDASGKVSRRLLGAAWAALHKGFRGNVYEGPDKAAAISKLKSLYKSEGLEPPGENASIQEVIGMTEELEVTVEQPETIDPEKFVSRDEYETLRAQATAEKERFDALKAELDAEKLARQKERLTSEAENFKALAFEIDEYVEKMSAIESSDPELATWLKAKWSAIDEAMHESGLMEEIGTDREGGLETLHDVAVRIVKEDFGGNMSHYAEALSAAGMKRPDLTKEYKG